MLAVATVWEEGHDSPAFREPCLLWTRHLPELVSLDDMRAILVNRLATIMFALDQTETEARAKGHGVPIPTDRLAEEQGFAQVCLHEFRQSELIAAHTEAGRYRDHLRRGITYDRVLHYVTNIRERMSEDLQLRQYAYVPADKTGFLTNLETDWATVWSRFPSVEGDATDGVSALVVGLNTACVFHMMVVLEYGLRALAKKLVIPARSHDWGQILRDIESKIASERAALRATPRGSAPPSPQAARNKVQFLDFCSEAATQFAFFKDAWRNHTAHGRRRYDEYEAERIMVRVRDFMTFLSRRLREVK